ncbi:MAG: carboxypeptidase regulatory-like domain-containing protein [Gemmatimonadaceae bacterium]|nr:carboxypeptidase regulatory-like domain-containing protein [Gemmatimonadaceae bacterium]
MLRVVVALALSSLATAPLLSAQAPVRVQVRGTAFDSISMRPLAGALVRLVRVDDPSVGRSSTSDSTGAFRVADLPAGAWLATMLHPVLDSLRLEPGVVRLELTESGDVDLPLTTPSVLSVATATCGAALPTDDGLLVGSVRDATTDLAVPLTQVHVAWPEFLLSGKNLTTVMQARTARADSLGRFAICGAPRGVTMRARAVLEADSTGMIAVTMPDGGYGVQDFLMARGTRDSSVAQGTGTSAPSRGPVTVRGRVTREDGSALRGALVRLIDVGSTVRSGANGGFAITDASAGTQTVEARMIGYTPHRRTVQVKSTGTDEIVLVLPVQRPQLDTVRVAADRPVSAEVRGIEARARGGTGRFFSGDVIRERSSVYVTDILRGMNGLVVTGGQRGNKVQMKNFGAREPLCSPYVYFDGALVQVGGNEPSSLIIDDFVTRDDVAAMEVYARGSAVPSEFAGGNTGCGVIAVWSRRAAGAASVAPQGIDKKP